MAFINHVFRRTMISVPARYIGNAATTGASASSHGNSKKWKNLSFFVAFPAVGLALANVFLQSSEERERPEFVPYEHMRIRTKRFPWGEGQRSLFHNPHVNALPTGYED
ncbi:cytochrome c oxidase subunit 6A1, mitochondrial-like [Armigeres subalbatus]|uniref:cytochrome c oxidase subunit 6A1, mitochondrial-like n=1 Tax=Armigeres subalbatus TaxID=124917 RepID=UPI002ED22309